MQIWFKDSEIYRMLSALDFIALLKCHGLKLPEIKVLLVILTQIRITMSDHHKEAEQNEIGGPVVFALLLLAIAVTIIYFLG